MRIIVNIGNEALEAGRQARSNKNIMKNAV
jgi:hypothetical protein